MPRPTGMRISSTAVMVGVLAALSGWMVRGIQFDAEASPVSPQVSSVAPIPAVDAEVPALRVEKPAYAAHATRSTRDLFGYVERAVPVAKPAVFHPPPVVAAPVVVVQQPIPERPRARFTHRYIGRFGPDHRPIAAFVRDGQIVTVRVGERIDEKFVLRSVDIESVQVEATLDGEVQSERVALNGSR